MCRNAGKFCCLWITHAWTWLINSRTGEQQSGRPNSSTWESTCIQGEASRVESSEGQTEQRTPHKYSHTSTRTESQINYAFMSLQYVADNTHTQAGTHTFAVGQHYNNGHCSSKDNGRPTGPSTELTSCPAHSTANNKCLQLNAL